MPRAPNNNWGLSLQYLNFLRDLSRKAPLGFLDFNCMILKAPSLPR